MMTVQCSILIINVANKESLLQGVIESAKYKRYCLANVSYNLHKNEEILSNTDLILNNKYELIT